MKGTLLSHSEKGLAVGHRVIQVLGCTLKGQYGNTGFTVRKGFEKGSQKGF